MRYVKKYYYRALATTLTVHGLVLHVVLKKMQDIFSNPKASDGTEIGPVKTGLTVLVAMALY